MLRSALVVLAAAAAFSLAGCCGCLKPCPVCPGTPHKPDSKIVQTPVKPVVWKIMRGSATIALAYEPEAAGADWTILYANGVLPFRSSDSFGTVLSEGTVVPVEVLCSMLRTEITLSHAQTPAEPLDFNVLLSPASCGP